MPHRRPAPNCPLSAVPLISAQHRAVKRPAAQKYAPPTANSSIATAPPQHHNFTTLHHHSIATTPTPQLLWLWSGLMLRDKTPPDCLGLGWPNTAVGSVFSHRTQQPTASSIDIIVTCSREPGCAPRWCLLVTCSMVTLRYSPVISCHDSQAVGLLL